MVSFDKSDADFHASRATIGRLNKRVAILATVVQLRVTMVLGGRTSDEAYFGEDPTCRSAFAPSTGTHNGNASPPIKR